MAGAHSGSSVELALLANTVPAAAALIALIHTLAPVSGGHPNRAHGLATARRGRLGLADMFAGIGPHDLPAFVLVPLVAAAGAAALSAWLAGEQFGRRGEPSFPSSN